MARLGGETEHVASGAGVGVGWRRSPVAGAEGSGTAEEGRPPPPTSFRRAISPGCRRRTTQAARRSHAHMVVPLSKRDIPMARREFVTLHAPC
eukprot:365209-Chlamydomonas_euryale.AAC.15